MKQNALEKLIVLRVKVAFSYWYHF